MILPFQPELKPCPFCGKAVHVDACLCLICRVFGIWYSIICECDVARMCDKDPRKLVERWNERKA